MAVTKYVFVNGLNWSQTEDGENNNVTDSKVRELAGVLSMEDESNFIHVHNETFSKEFMEACLKNAGTLATLAAAVTAALGIAAKKIPLEILSWVVQTPKVSLVTNAKNVAVTV
jgi:hypothetical protein